MNAHGTWPHAFINSFWYNHMTSFWERMRRHVHANRDWAQHTWWMPVDADVKRVNWDNCHIENWDYQWFLDPTHRAPQWTDLTPAYRQYWIWLMLPTHNDNRYYFAWINDEEDETPTKQRQLTRWINEWNNMGQRSKMCYFDPVIATERARSLQPGAKLDMITPNPFNISAYAIDTAVLPGREEQLHGRPLSVTNVHVGTELVYVGNPWNLLPAFEPNSRLWVKEIAVKSSFEYNDYLLENGDHSVTDWIHARTLCVYINKDVLRIVPRTKLDALRSGPRRH